MKQLLGGLLALYVVELVLSATGAPVQLLAWLPLGQGFAPWQPLTRFAVQGPSVLNVLIALAVAWFVFPALDQLLRREQLGEATLAMAAAATVLPLTAELAGVLSPGIIVGWTSLVGGWIVLFGLARPDGEVRLYFVLPVTGQMIVWGMLGIEVLMLLAAPNTASLEPIGVWVGAWAWWNYRGPGARRRHLRREGARVERELRRFQVLDGGRSDSQDGPNRDGWIH